MAEPEFQIGGGGGHADPEITGGGSLKKVLFGPSDLGLV